MPPRHHHGVTGRTTLNLFTVDKGRTQCLVAVLHSGPAPSHPGPPSVASAWDTKLPLDVSFPSARKSASHPPKRTLHAALPCRRVPTHSTQAQPSLSQTPLMTSQSSQSRQPSHVESQPRRPTRADALAAGGRVAQPGGQSPFQTALAIAGRILAMRDEFAARSGNGFSRPFEPSSPTHPLAHHHSSAASGAD